MFKSPFLSVMAGRVIAVGLNGNGPEMPARMACLSAGSIFESDESLIHPSIS